MSSIYFGTIFQINTLPGTPAITNFRLPDGTIPDGFFTGIPLIVICLTNRNGTIGLYEITNRRIFSENTRATTATILTYINYTTFDDTKKYYFSTLKDGNEFSPSSTAIPALIIGGVTITPAVPGIPAVIINPPTSKRYNVYRYFTSLNYGDINLNSYTDVVLGWSSSDISGSYGDDVVDISLYKQDGNLQKYIGRGPNQTSLPIAVFAGIQSGTYYYIYDFVSYRLDALQQLGYPVDYTYGTNTDQRTGTFNFITQFLQTVSATTATHGGTSTISINVGYGYPYYSYTLAINDVNNFSTYTTFPYTYTPPAVTNTRTYNVTVSNSSDSNDTGTHTTQFTAYRYVTSITIANKIIQSAQNYLTWIGGSATESFKYDGSSLLTTNGSTGFTSGNKIDSGGLTAGVGYSIQPNESRENNQSYGVFYFDSIAPNQHITIRNNRIQQTYSLTWNAYYTSSSPAPDGTRNYPVTFTGNGLTYTSTSTYNVLTIPFSAVVYGVPYSIQVVDVVIATDIYFFDVPENFGIAPNNINYVNTLTWTAIGNPIFNVRMGNFTFQDRSPSIQTLTENVIQPIGDVSFWPLNSTEESSIITDSYFLNINTFTILFDASVSILESVNLTYVIGSYLYADTYSLSIYRNGQIIPLESTIPTPFTWVPLQYAVQYQQHDQLYIKSNQHTNYGLSAPITFRINATVTLDKPVYTNFSTIVATINNNSTFLLQLQDTTNLHPPIPVTFTFYNNQYYIHLNTYAIPLGTYQLEFLLSTSPAIMIASPSFLITSPVTLDQTSYTIASIIHATLYVSVPTTFTVQLQDAANVNEPISLPPLNAYLSSTYSFNAYYLNVTNTNYYLKFISTITLESPVFSMSTTYFTLNKPRTPVPDFARASSNILCVTAKKNNVPTVVITVFESIAYPKAITGKPQFLVPCGILKYFQEFNQLLKTLTLRDALLLLIQKYDIPVATPAITNYKRYQYPTGNAKILKPILQYTASFRLGNKIAGYEVPDSMIIVEKVDDVTKRTIKVAEPQSNYFVDKVNDARVFGMCNDDTKTFSFLYTDMIDNASYWLNTLPPIEYDTAYIYCVVRPINGIIKQIITASITLINNQLVFTPLILRVLLSFYNPYPPGDITILYASSSLTDILNYLKAAYEKNFINPATAI